MGKTSFLYFIHLGIGLLAKLNTGLSDVGSVCI